MDYKAKEQKGRREALLCVAVLIGLAAAYGAYTYFTQPAVSWGLTEYKIPDFRNADAQHLGRQYELPVQEELNLLIQETVEATYAANKVKSPDNHTFMNTFEETFKKELKITVEKKDPQGTVAKSWQLLLNKTDDMPSKVKAFAVSIVNQP